MEDIGDKCNNLSKGQRKDGSQAAQRHIKCSIRGAGEKHGSSGTAYILGGFKCHPKEHGLILKVPKRH